MVYDVFKLVILRLAEKENLLSPLQVIDIMSRSKSLTVEDVKAYLSSTLKSESKLIENENSQIEKRKQETENIRQRIKQIKNK